jgi:HD-like signal output (HDOD) protein
VSEEKLNVLFVDDEPKIVDGLRRQLRDRRNEWDMRFATSGEMALKLLGERHADVIVSDMRMPGMTGGQLLERVRDLHPQATRIILSGQTDEAELVGVLGSVHQYLQKPCNGENLCRSIDRTRKLAKLLSQSALREAANRVVALPPATDSYRALTKELAKPDACIAKVAAIVSGDPALAAKVMQLVNSAFFGMPRRVDSPDAAVVLLGLNTIHGIVVAGRIFEFVARSAAQQSLISALWQSSVRIGESAARFAKSNGAAEAVVARARLTGLLCLIGRVVLLTTTEDDFAKVTARVNEKTSSYAQAEGIIYGATQDEVSAYALGLWAFPDEMIEAVASQSQPSTILAETRNELAAYLHLARATHTPAAMGMDEAVEIDRSFLVRWGFESLIPEPERKAA